MKFAGLLLSALAIAAPGLRADNTHDGSASARLVVSATVVSTCSIASTNGQVTLRCARGATGVVRVDNRIAPGAEPRDTVLARTTAAGTLVTIDF